MDGLAGAGFLLDVSGVPLAAGAQDEALAFDGDFDLVALAQVGHPAGGDDLAHVVEPLPRVDVDAFAHGGDADAGADGGFVVHLAVVCLAKARFDNPPGPGQRDANSTLPARATPRKRCLPISRKRLNCTSNR